MDSEKWKRMRKNISTSVFSEPTMSMSWKTLLTSVNTKYQDQKSRTCENYQADFFEVSESLTIYFFQSKKDGSLEFAEVQKSAK